jgi:hypothetical protein
MSWPTRCFDLWVGSESPVVDVAEETSWRERAERAEARAERAEARIEELVEQVAVLSRMLSPRSWPPTAPPASPTTGPPATKAIPMRDTDGYPEEIPAIVGGNGRPQPITIYPHRPPRGSTRRRAQRH